MPLPLQGDDTKVVDDTELETVLIIGPTSDKNTKGRHREEIPRKQLQSAISQGYREAVYVRNPEGGIGTIPKSKLKYFLSKGYWWLPPGERDLTQSMPLPSTTPEEKPDFFGRRNIDTGKPLEDGSLSIPYLLRSPGTISGDTTSGWNTTPYDPSLSVLESIKQFIYNIPPSISNLVGGAVSVVTNPIDTATTLSQLGTGAISKATRGLSPEVRGAAGEPLAEAFGQEMKKRYGGIDEIGNTLYQDPAGAAGDIAALVTGVGGGLRALTRLPAKISRNPAGRSTLRTLSKRLEGTWKDNPPVIPADALLDKATKIDQMVKTGKSLGKPRKGKTFKEKSLAYYDQFKDDPAAFARHNIDPISATFYHSRKALEPIETWVEKMATDISGLATGTSGVVVRQFSPFKYRDASGKIVRRKPVSKELKESLRSDRSEIEVVDQALEGLREMRRFASEVYKGDMAEVIKKSGDKRLSLEPIRQAMKDILTDPAPEGFNVMIVPPKPSSSVTLKHPYRIPRQRSSGKWDTFPPPKMKKSKELLDWEHAYGRQKPGDLDFSRALGIPKEFRGDVKHLYAEVMNWGKRDFDSTIIGVDQLKRSLQGYWTPTSKIRNTVARKTSQAAKKVLEDNVPDYKGITKEYQKYAELIHEIETELSLGYKGTKGSALRKLSTVISQDGDYRQTLIGALDKLTKRSLLEELSALQMKNLIPNTLVARGFLGATLYDFMTGSIITGAGRMLAGSPRLTAESLVLLGNIMKGRVGQRVADLRKLAVNLGTQSVIRSPSIIAAPIAADLENMGPISANVYAPGSVSARSMRGGPDEINITDIESNRDAQQISRERSWARQFGRESYPERLPVWDDKGLGETSSTDFPQ
jgi:hypothetical protein